MRRRTDVIVPLPHVEPPYKLIAPTRRENMGWEGVDTRRRDEENQRAIASTLSKRWGSRLTLRSSLSPTKVATQENNIGTSACLLVWVF